jgi:hypothetical protein
LLDGGAIGRAAVTGHAVAIVTHLACLNGAVAAAGHVDAADALPPGATVVDRAAEIETASITARVARAAAAIVRFAAAAASAVHDLGVTACEGANRDREERDRKPACGA